MPQTQKLYQLLEKAQIETKIAVEIQDWIVETLEESRKKTMFQFEDTKLLPMHQEMRVKFEVMDHRLTLIDEKIGRLESKFEDKFNSLRSETNVRFDALLSSNRLLSIPIVGATIGGLGVVLLEILKRFGQ